MRISAAEWKAGKLILTTSDPEAVRFGLRFPGEGEYSLSPVKKKRSLDANAYCFVLCDKIAAATGITKTEVYRAAIREIGGNSDVVRAKTEAADAVRAAWEGRGLGWQTDVLPSAAHGYVNIILYYGSSTYDTGQMSRLIDNLVQDAQALGIETLSPEKLEGMMEAWDGRR